MFRQEARLEWRQAIEESARVDVEVLRIHGFEGGVPRLGHEAFDRRERDQAIAARSDDQQRALDLARADDRAIGADREQNTGWLVSLPRRQGYPTRPQPSGP